MTIVIMGRCILFSFICLFSINVFGALKLLPVSRHKGLVVSLGEKGLPEELKNNLVGLRKGESNQELPAHTIVNGALKERLFEVFKLDRDKSVYYFVFSEKKVGSFKLADIDGFSVHYNEADGMIGTIGIPVPHAEAGQSMDLLVGLAAISEENPFDLKSFNEVSWKADQRKVGAGKVLHPEYYLEKDRKNLKLQDEKRLFARSGFVDFYLNEAFVVVRADYITRQFQLQIKVGDKTLKELVGQGEYDSPPEHVWTGEILRSGEQAIIVSPTGMGSCGNVFFVKPSGGVTEAKLPCGSWGC